MNKSRPPRPKRTSEAGDCLDDERPPPRASEHEPGAEAGGARAADVDQLAIG
jgi:hypothetical protein